MSENVVELNCITRLDLPAEKVLQKAIDLGLDQVVIVGFTADGDEYFASSVADGGTAMYHLQRGIWNLNKITDRIAEEGLPE